MNPRCLAGKIGQILDNFRLDKEWDR